MSKTKLHKALLYCDLEQYLATSRPITGETYVKDDFGPVSVHLDEVLDELAQEGAIRMYQESDYSPAIGHYTQNQYISLRPPNTDHFSEDELQLVKGVVKWIKSMKSREISEFSHTFAYHCAQDGEELPYFTAFAYFLRPPNQREVNAGLQMLRERNAVPNTTAS
ncbi:SocA family protein [bacterium]|nr:SocA family protein [bacterium]